MNNNISSSPVILHTNVPCLGTHLYKRCHIIKLKPYFIFPHPTSIFVITDWKKDILKRTKGTLQIRKDTLQARKDILQKTKGIIYEEKGTL